MMGSVLGVFRVIREEWLSFWIFVAINLVFGGMAVWLPPVIASQHPTATPAHELRTAMELGHAYLFALALLAAAVSYMVREYRQNAKTEFKDLKLYATFCSLFLMFLMGVLLASMISGGMSSPRVPKEVFWTPLITESMLAALALLMAAFLFCLEHLDDYPDYGKGLKDKAAKTIKSGMNGQSSTGIET